MIESKVKGNRRDEDKIDYPCLMESDIGRVVLMTSDKCGVVLINPIGDSTFMVGDYDDGWRMDKFKPFKGTIELKNK